jgi:hypothetical protein
MMATQHHAAPAERITVHEAELRRPQYKGRYVYAFCHIHGSDHQRSLHINQENGFGDCKACGVQVFCPEIAPDGGASYGRAQTRRRRVTAAALLRPRSHRATAAPSASSQSNAPTATIDPARRDELEALTALDGRMRARLSDARARAYLAARGIDYEVAEAAGVGYIPADARLAGALAKWRDRLIFPLGSPDGRGYIGRSLWGWQPDSGLDENAHKALLDAADGAEHRRWEKTNPAGWLGYGDLAGVDVAVMVEGAIDALALQSAGLWHAPVVALAGTAAPVDWLPVTVLGVVLALDGDAAGVTRAEAIADELRRAGVTVCRCAPPEDGQGKDWAERWRRAGADGVAPVFAALDALQRDLAPAEILAPEPSHSVTTSAPIPGHSGTESPRESAPIAQHSATESTAEPSHSVTESAEILAPIAQHSAAISSALVAESDALEATVRADALVSRLLARGYVLADVHSDLAAHCDGTGWGHVYAEQRTADWRPVCIECGQSAAA